MLTSKEGNEFEDATKYRIVGSLIYLTTTKPNILFAVGIISSFVQKPCEGHWCVAKRVLSYFKGTQDFGLKYSNVDEFKLVGHTNSDFDGGKDNEVSTLGYPMSLGSTTISWGLHKQSITTDSSIEVEYVVFVKVEKEIVWLRKKLNDLQEKHVNATPVLIDNTYAIKLAKYPRSHD
jgi:hypothetical protein